MELTRQQKAGTLIAAIALAALGVDKLLLGGAGPAAASAQDLGPESAVAPPASVRSPVSSPRDSLASRLADFAAGEAIDPCGEVPDLFSQSQWTLRAVFGEGERGGVKIAEELVHVGGEYDGALLVSVSRDGAVFRKAGREFFVALERPRLGDARQSPATPDSPRRER